MGILKRADVAPPTPLGKETVAVPALGGDVVVRGMTLSERLVVSSADGFEGISFALSRCVLDADGEPLLDRDQWEIFGANHTQTAIDLFVVVKRLSLIDRSDVEKK